jgi:hypothetical protein
MTLIQYINVIFFLLNKLARDKFILYWTQELSQYFYPLSLLMDCGPMSYIYVM